MNSIRTEYNGIIFRSRLEATWAAFFDLIGWQWEYEPFDLDGYIPDFGIKTINNYSEHHQFHNGLILVEVKPVFSLKEFSSKIFDYQNTHSLLLLGAGLQTTDDLQDCSIFTKNKFLGWTNDIACVASNEEGADIGIAVPGRWIGSESTAKNPKNIIGFCHEIQSFHDRITGCYDGGSFGCGNFDFSEMENAWAKAKNTTQWNR